MQENCNEKKNNNNESLTGSNFLLSSVINIICTTPRDPKKFV